MRKTLLLPLLLLPAAVFCQTFTFDAPYLLECAGTDINVGYYAAPCIADWDGDDVNDLILGQFSNGYVRFYKNEGTNEAPVLNSFSYLYADGSLITMAYG